MQHQLDDLRALRGIKSLIPKQSLQLIRRARYRIIMPATEVMLSSANDISPEAPDAVSLAKPIKPSG